MVHHGRERSWNRARAVIVIVTPGGCVFSLSVELIVEN